MKRVVVSAVLFVSVAVLAASLQAQGRGGAAPPAPPIDPHDISGFWSLGIDGRRVPPARLIPAMTKAALDRSAKKDTHNVRWCNLIGTPAVMDSGRPLDIRQGPTAIIVVPELSQASPRYLYFRSEHVNAEIFDPSTNGDSTARWDGDTLVVDTVGFHEAHGLLAIPGGGYRTPTSHLVERYALLQNGAILSVTSIWTDPNMFAAPHTYEFRYSRMPPFYEAQLPTGCSAYDELRSQFLEGTPGKSGAAGPSKGTAPVPPGQGRGRGRSGS
ncbi:MAG: hypothetical protein ABIX28_13255 [Vicinamibacterales bacterium]